MAVLAQNINKAAKQERKFQIAGRNQYCKWQADGNNIQQIECVQNKKGKGDNIAYGKC